MLAASSGSTTCPLSRAIDTPKDGDHGSFQNRDYLGERTITMALEIFADTAQLYRNLVDSVIAATIVQPVELPLFLYNSTRLIYCRPRRRSIPYDAENLRRSGEATIEFVATDPRIYDAIPTQLTQSVAVVSSGRTYNRVYPMTYGAALGGSGTFQVTNTGTFPTRPTVHITGPVDNPRFEATDQSKKIELAITLAATDYIDIDFMARSVVLNGTASRRSLMTPDSAWFEILPGVNNLRYSANTTQTGSTMTLAYRSAWI